jgi:putative transposase
MGTETMMSEERRNKIKNSLKITKEKRKTQDVIVLKLKIDKDKLNNKSIKTLNTMFLESKWLYNYILDKEFNNDIFKFDYKTNYANVYVKDHYEKRKINYLSAQMKQDLLKRTKNNISGLHELKENGFKIGKLKFKKEINSIPLRQFGKGKTYNIINNNYIKIQRIKQPLKVNGFYETFTDDENIKHKELKYDLNALDFGNAMLIHKNNNYYIYITAYTEKEETDNNRIIGIDTGIKTQLTLSNGLKLEYNIPKSKREIRLQRGLSRKAKYVEGANSKKKLSREQSNNYYKNKNRLNREQQKRNNKKRDVKNKIVHYLTSNYKIIITQKFLVCVIVS